MSSKKTHNFIHVLKKSQKICFTKMKIATQFSAIKNRQDVTILVNLSDT